jgi:REP element-mobilizing transposase RayT
MPNHVHMILRISSENVLQGPMWASAPTNANISSLVRSWKTLVTKELGCSIWQRSFYDHVIRDEKEYVLIAHYIEENPAKWFDDTYYSPV